MSEKRSFPAIPAVLLSTVSVQGGASIAKKLFPFLGAYGTSSVRIGLSAVILSIINRPKISGLSAKQWLYSMGYGICLGAMNLCFYLAILRIPLGLGVAIEFLGPLALAIIGSRRILDIVWALLAFSGVLLIVPWQNNGIDIMGIIFALLAGLFWAFYIILGGKISRIMKNGDAVTIGMCFAALFILPFGIISGELMNMNIELFLMGLGVAVLSGVVPYSLDLIGLNKLPAKTFSILMSLQPAVGALSGMIFLKEYLSVTQWISVFCVIIASIGTTVFTKKRTG